MENSFEKFNFEGFAHSSRDETGTLYNINEAKMLTKEQVSYQRELKEVLTPAPKEKQQKIFDFKDIEDLKV